MPPGMPPHQGGPNRAPLWIGLGAGALVLIVVGVLALTGVFSGEDPPATTDDVATTEDAQPQEEPPPSDPGEDANGSDVQYAWHEDPCDVIDIDSYFALASGGDATGEDTGTNSSAGEFGSGHCNFTQMQGVGVFVMAEVTLDTRAAQDRYDYQKDIIEIGKFDAVTPACAAQWDQFTGTDKVEPYPFDLEYKFVALHSNFMIGMTIRLDDGGLSIDEVAEMGCATMDIFVDAYSSLLFTRYRLSEWRRHAVGKSPGGPAV